MRYSSPEDFPKDAQWLPRALSDRVMAQLEHLDNLGRWNNPGHRRASQRAWDEGSFGPPLAARRAGSAPGHAMPQQWRMQLQRM
jgi:hypothetical protein